MTVTVPETLAASHSAPPSDTEQNAVIARVNGKPIAKSDLLAVLLVGRGKTVLDELILLEAVRQRAAQVGIAAAPHLVDAELDSILREMAPDQSARQQQALLQYMLQSRGLTRPEFDLIIQRQALLRQLVDPNVTITDQMLADEFQRRFGPKVLVRQLLLSSLHRIQQAQQRLQDGQDFAQLVRQMSEDELTLARQGLLGPFSTADEHIPQPVRDAAFKLQKPGQLSLPIRYLDQNNRSWWSLLQLEKLIPPDPSASPAKSDQVRQELSSNLRQRIIRDKMFQLQQTIKDQANVEILDPALRSGEK